MLRQCAPKWILFSVIFLIFPFISVAQEEATNPLPVPTGPHQVGTTVYHWVDESRYEILADLPQGSRLEPGAAITTVTPAPLKTQPNSRSDTVATLEALELLNVIEVDGPWARVEHGDTEGWILSTGLINVDISSENKRELVAQVWYPADVEAGATVAPYVPDNDMFITEMSRAVSEIIGVTPSPSVDFPSHAFTDVPVSSEQDSYPVLIFSHGQGAVIPQSYSTQLEELASHGYIVVGINHTYSSSVAIFPDGRTAKYSLTLEDSPIAARVAAADQTFVVNQLEELNNDENSLFAGKMNLEMLGTFGHSMGGTASTLACAKDKRFRACMSQDGPPLFSWQEMMIDQPFMFMYAERAAGTNDAIFRQLSGPGYSVIFGGLGHINFIDFSLWLTSERERIPTWIGSIAETRSVPLINAYVLAFFDTYLKGEPSTLLNGPAAEYPEADIQSRNTE